MTTRFVKFNIKDFLEKYLFESVSGNVDECRDLIESFKVFYFNSTTVIQEQTKKYLESSDLVKGNKTFLKLLEDITE